MAALDLEPVEELDLEEVPTLDLEPVEAAPAQEQREVGVVESLGRGAKDAAYSVAEITNRALSVMPAIVDAAAGVAGFEPKVRERWEGAMVSPAQVERKEAQVNPETETQGIPARIAGTLPIIARDLAAVTATNLAAPQLQAARAGASLLEVLGPLLSRGAGAMAGPGGIAGMDAQERARESGASDLEAIAAGTVEQAKMAAMGALPLGVSSGAGNVLSRFLSRSAQAAPLVAGQNEAFKAGEALIRGNSYEFDPEQALVETLPMTVIGGAVGGRTARPVSLRETVARLNGENPEAPLAPFTDKTVAVPETIPAGVDETGQISGPVDSGSTLQNKTSVPNLQQETPLTPDTPALARETGAPDPIGTTESIAEIERRNAPDYRPNIPVEKPGTAFPAAETAASGRLNENAQEVQTTPETALEAPRQEASQTQAEPLGVGESVAPEIQQRVAEVAKNPGQAGLVKGLADQAREGFGPGAAVATEFAELSKTNAREYATIGASHLLEGKTDRATWTEAMKQEYGARDASPAELNKIWRDSHEFVSEFGESQVDGTVVRPKTQIEKATGIKVTEEPTIKESQALKIKMRAEQKAAAEGFKAGKLESVSKIRPIVESLRETLSNSISKAEALGVYLGGMQKGSKIGAQAARRDVTAQMKVADRWLEADRNTIREKLLDFSMQLPLNERAKFLPSITNALRRAPITSRDPAVMYRRAADVLDRMTGAVYEVKRADVTTRIENLLAKNETAKNMTVPEKEAIRQRGITFNNLKDKMSLDMLENMQERMQEIRQQGKDLFVLDQVIQQEKVKTTLREITTQGTRKVDLPEQTRLALGETESAWQKRIDQFKRVPEFIKHFNLSLTPMDWMIQTFDKAPQGAIYKTIKVPVDVRYGEWLDSTAAYKDRLSKVVQKHGLKPGNLDRVYAHAELRQEGGQANLEALGYSKAEINSAKTLSRAELEYLREADAINNELFPHLKKVLSESFHQEVDKVQGYFPRQRDWDYYNTLSIEEGKFARSMNRTNTEKGFTVSRVGATTKNITDAHKVMMNHIDDVLYHIKMGPEIRRVADVVKSEEFKGSVGTWGQKVFSDWTDVLSRNGGIGAGRRIHALDTLRKNVGVAQLAFRLTTTALQPLSLIQGMSVVSPKNMVVALDGAMSKTRRQFILKNFPEIRARVGDDPAYSDYGGASLRDKAGRAGFKGIALLDRFAAMTVAEAAYRDSLSARGLKFDLNKVDAQGVQDAQLAVRKTQSSSYPKDLPLAISRGNFSGNASVDKSIFQFQNFLINKWALVKNGALQMGIEEKSPQAGARIMAFIILGTIAEQLSRDGIAKAVQATVGTSPQQAKKNEKDSEKAYALKISEKAAADLVTGMPIVSNIYGMARFEGSGVPVVDTLGKAVEGATRIVEGKKPETKAVGAIRAAQAVGALAGVPTGQVGDVAAQAVRANVVTKEETTKRRYAEKRY